nr:copper resistance protein B [Pseudomonas sp. B14(2017)]
MPNKAGERQQAALRLEAAYAMLLADRWISDRPWGRNDTRRVQGSGLVAGIRPRF